MKLKFSKHFLAVLAVFAMLFCVDNSAVAQPFMASMMIASQNTFETNMNCCPKTANHSSGNCVNFCTPIQAKIVDISQIIIAHTIAFEIKNQSLFGQSIEPAIPPPREFPS